MAKVLQNMITSYVSINIVEDEIAWQSNAIYNYADEMRDGHYIYKYAGSSGTNSADAPHIDYLKPETVRVWVRVRPTNYWAMLDGDSSTQTQNEDTIVVEVSCSNFDTISLLGVEAESVKIELLGIDYTRTFDLRDESGVVDEFSYWFSDFVFKESIFMDDIPLFTGATLKVTIDNTGEIAKCGRLVCGRSFYLGITQYGATLDYERYSINKTDEFGYTDAIHRDPALRDDFNIQIPTNKIPTIRRKVAEWDAVPLLFILDESANSNVENLLNYGTIERFTTLWENGTTSMVSMTIKSIKQIKG